MCRLPWDWLAEPQRVRWTWRALQAEGLARAGPCDSTGKGWETVRLPQRKGNRRRVLTHWKDKHLPKASPQEAVPDPRLRPGDGSLNPPRHYMRPPQQSAQTLGPTNYYQRLPFVGNVLDTADTQWVNNKQKQTEALSSGLTTQQRSQSQNQTNSTKVQV